jgi:hypothetical protein
LLVARISCGLALYASDSELSATPPGPDPAANSAVRGTDPPGPPPPDLRSEHLLVARRELEWVLDHCPPERRPPLVRMHVRLIQLLTDAPLAPDLSESWRTLVEEARRTTVAYELHEVVHLAAAAALRDGRLEDAHRYRHEGAALAGPSDCWQERFAALPAAVTGSRSWPLPPTPRIQAAAQSAVQYERGGSDDQAPVDQLDCRPADGVV